MDTLRISVVGTGYVGIVTGLCLSELGNEVLCLDVVPEKIELLKKGRSPIYEPGIEGILTRHLKNGSFRASTNVAGIVETDVTFICVGTPPRKDGSLDLGSLEKAAKEIGTQISKKEGYHLVVVKSTVVPSTTERVVVPALEKASGRKAGRDFGVGVNPEFLKEGDAINDFMNPDRVVIGSIDERSREAIRSLYAKFNCPIVEVSLSTAEMIKVASNAFLATKISFINEIGNVCKAANIDVREVARGMGYDKRIGPHFLRAGAGFGGSCFPKDVSALASEAKRMGIEPLLVEATLEVNRRQPLRMIDLLDRIMDVRGKTIAVLGLAFKPGTDDIREASSRTIVRELLRRGATVKCHDPKAMDNFLREFPTVEFCPSAKECVRGSEAVLIVTEWDEYSDPSLYGDKLVIDGRGVVRTKNYEGLCW